MIISQKRGFFFNLKKKKKKTEADEWLSCEEKLSHKKYCIL